MAVQRGRRTSARPVPAALAVLVGSLVLTGCSDTGIKGSPAPDTLELPVAFALQRDHDGLQRAALQISNPADPAFREWRTAANIAEEFGADIETATQVLTTLRDAGFEGTLHPTRGLITGSLSPAEAQDLLGVSIVSVPAGEGMQVARPASPPDVPRALEGSVTSVVGLTLLYPTQARPSPTNAAPEQVTCAPASGIVEQVTDFYDLGPVVEAARGGEGVVMGMLQTDQSSPQALELFSECYDVRIAPVRNVAVDESDPTAFGTTAEESTLDIVAASLLAPNLEEIVTYQFNPRTSLVFPLALAVGDALMPGGPHIISTSIGVCGRTMRDQAVELSEWLLASAAAAGVTVVAASGDTGSSSCVPDDTSEASQYPASSIFVTGVGGTQPVRKDGALVGQRVWNSSPASQNAGGGSTVSRFERPFYQEGLPFPGGRIVPDLSFFAAPAAFGPIPVCDVNGGCVLRVVGGTSATAPGFAAALSEVMDGLAPGSAEPQRLGLLNPWIYDRASRPTSEPIVMDVVDGDNDLYEVGCCTAVPGFDPASGWGSIKFGALFAELQRSIN